MIRQALPGDIDRICALEAVLFPDNALSYLMLEYELAVSRVLVVGDPLCAYAIVGQDHELLDLLRLGVDLNHQGCGVGTNLLKHVLALGQPVMLTVRKNNLRAIQLYRKYGFVITSHFSAEASWVMRWEPASAVGPLH